MKYTVQEVLGDSNNLNTIKYQWYATAYTKIRVGLRKARFLISISERVCPNPNYALTDIKVITDDNHSELSNSRRTQKAEISQTQNKVKLGPSASRKRDERGVVRRGAAKADALIRELADVKSSKLIAKREYYRNYYRIRKQKQNDQGE